MKKKLIVFSVLLLTGLISFSVHAEKYIGENGNNRGNGNRVKAEGCAPARAYNELSIGNVRCRINTGGDMWWDLVTNPVYEIPKDSKKHSMFCAALWIGGRDATGAVKVAAQRYRAGGNDFWPGPLTTDGLASIEREVCKDYDKHWILKREDVQKLRNWQKNNDAYPGYAIPDVIAKYPAHGDVSLRQPQFLAPFYDGDGDYKYTPSGVDYPYFDFNNEFAEPGNSRPTPEGNGIMSDQILKGDVTLWWVFNDKGNVHSETDGEAIGLEFRAQAFAFATSDEINDMTFYSYEIINRGTFRLDSTFFCQWTDTDLGYAFDDYVGCDVRRGLGYCYNGYDVDGTGQADEYGAQPPAIGVDFFQGPYLDPDTLDNFWPFDPLRPDYVPADVDDPAWNSINGLNFGDSIIDNERFGMKSFLFHNNSSNTINSDPSNYDQYYRYLRGFWKNGDPMGYGGNAILPSTSTSGTATEVVAKFMYPGDTDPWLWGTHRINPNYNNGTNYWTEKQCDNEVGDRRIMQSAGPFTLEPGAVNYITVGIPWARATSGGAFASVEKLRIVDDKCQLLFINNFRMIDGPDAPIIKYQEMDKEIILYLTYPKTSNNYGANYQEGDYRIITPFGEPEKWDSIYRFEGYQIFQLKDKITTIGDITDPNKARLVGQCDIKNGVGTLINYNNKAELGGEVPQIMVTGEDKGLRHTFRIFEDQFAEGDKRLINNKQYYFIAVAYGYNSYKKYIQNSPNNIDGQKFPYLQGRFNGDKGPITPVEITPHNPIVENGGTVTHAVFGDQPIIEKIEGQGNGGNYIDLEEETINEIMSGAPWRAKLHKYKKNYGPVKIEVVDPLAVKSANFTMKFVQVTNRDSNLYTTLTGTVDSADWVLIDNNTNMPIVSHRNIAILYEQLLPEYGISVTIQQPLPVWAPSDFANVNVYRKDAFLGSSLTFSGSEQWLSPISDNDKYDEYDWILAGSDFKENNADYRIDIDPKLGKRAFFDSEGQFEKVINGSWAPLGLVKAKDQFPGPITTNIISQEFRYNLISSIDVVLTSDKTKWTRCPVIEMCSNRDSADKGLPAWGDKHPAAVGITGINKRPVQYGLRWGQSVDKDGNAYPNADTISSNDPNAPNYIAATSMGWFPGYAINTETGERLNMAFSENSDLTAHNGRDMQYNPTDVLATYYGGMHYIYVFGHNDDVQYLAYDYGRTVYSNLTKVSANPSNNALKTFIRHSMWVGMMLKTPKTTWLNGDARIRIRVSKPYGRYYSLASNNAGSNAQNADNPMFTISLTGVETEYNSNQTAKDALELIRIVPNPYYGYSDYEQSQTDNRVRITNLPVKCTISIYNASGSLIRRFTRDDKEVTFQDWDLKNHAGIPISSGIYIFHIDAPGIGEKVVKWFAGMRPVDMNSF